jgi:Histidine kinase
MNPNSLVLVKKTTFGASILRGPNFQKNGMNWSINKATINRLLIYFFVGGGGIFVLGMVMFTGYDTNWSKLVKLFLVNGMTFFLFAIVNGRLADIIAARFPWVENPRKTFVIALFGTLVATTIVWLLVVYLWIGFLGNKIPTFADWRKDLGINSWLFSLIITIMVSAIVHSRNFLTGWKQTLVEAEKLKKEQAIAQYETLKTQVNPHFLFNSLNVLTTLVHKDADVAEQFINQLSKVYRYILESRSQEIIALEEEMRNLEAYVFLMQIRFGGNFIFHNQLTVNSNSYKVAPLTLQMLVENALKHNEISKMYPLSISVFLEENCIVVRNNLQLKTNQNDSTGIGLSNIKARYQFLSSEPVSISEADGFFTVKIPLIK